MFEKVVNKSSTEDKGHFFQEMRNFKSWTDYYRTKNNHLPNLDWSDRYLKTGSPASSPTRTRKLFGSSSSLKSPQSPRSPLSKKNSNLLYDPHSIENSSEEKSSSDELEVKNYKEEEIRKPRSGSKISFSNVRRKISTTFHRRSSHVEPPTSTHKPAPQRRASTANLLTRQSSLVEIGSPKDQPKLRRSSTIGHGMEVSRPISLETGHGHPLLDRLRNNIMQMDPFATSSTPNIQSRSRSNSTHPLKTFKILLLGSKSCGKTALTVRFLTGRYIGEYKSTSEEVYNRVVKYGDEQADVTIYANDVENMEEDVDLDENSGIMILYSIVDKSSYEKAKVLLEYLRDMNITGTFPVVLVGTKRDLSYARKVRRQHAFNLANSFNCTQFDVSAAGDRKVKDCFHTLFRQIEIRQLLHQEDGENSIHTILNPPKIFRHGTYRYGTM